MKKNRNTFLLATFTAILLSACSAGKLHKLAPNDSYGKIDAVEYETVTLKTGGVSLLPADKRYRLPAVIATSQKTAEKIDIRPPNTQNAFGHSIRLNDEGATLEYGDSQQQAYSLNQVKRLLQQRNIKTQTLDDGSLLTDWVAIDSDNSLMLRYQFAQADNEHQLTAKAVEATKAQQPIDLKKSELKLFAQRYLSDLANELHSVYMQQLQSSAKDQNAIQGLIMTDRQNRSALALSSHINRSWERLRNALLALDFAVLDENQSRGLRTLYYINTDPTLWKKYGSEDPKLAKGVYYAQLNPAAYDQSFVIISNENGVRLQDEQAQYVYLALKNALNRH